MKRIMFVCYGNICRSPMAEFVFKSKIKEGQCYISSSATHTDELGNPVYPPARKELLKHGINPDGKYAVRLNRDDYDKYDLFIGMDEANVRDMVRLFNGDKENKVKLLLSYAGENRGISDPYWDGSFEKSYEDIDKGTDGLIKELNLEKK